MQMYSLSAYLNKYCTHHSCNQHQVLVYQDLATQQAHNPLHILEIQKNMANGAESPKKSLHPSKDGQNYG